MGKSTRMLLDAADHVGRYLFAVPSIDLLEEQALRLKGLAPQATIVRIHSRSGEPSSVKRQIAALRERVEPHLVGFVTHEALLDADLAGFSGWHARIDEPPHGFHRGELSIAESLPYFENRFDLEPVGDGSPWSQLRPKSDLSWRKARKDALTAKIADFLKHAARPHGLFVKLVSWREAAQRPVAWFSLWTPLQLRAFKTVLIAGAGFLTSLTYRACLDLFGDELRFDVEDLSEPREAQPSITIHYFAERHEGSTTYWDTAEGRSCLVAICKWFEHSNLDIGYWSGNEIVRLLFHDRLAGERPSPKAAGLNCYRRHASCVFIYSSKAQPHDMRFHGDEPFSFSVDDVRRAREDEDILQFAWRGAIRNPDYSGPYDVYLYSRDQAERLERSLRRAGLLAVTLSSVREAGIMDVARPKNVGVRAPRNAEEEAARLARKREQGRMRTRRHRANARTALGSSG